jgi:hypothetical protein
MKIVEFKNNLSLNMGGKISILKPNNLYLFSDAV